MARQVALHTGIIVYELRAALQRKVQRHRAVASHDRGVVSGKSVDNIGIVNCAVPCKTVTCRDNCVAINDRQDGEMQRNHAVATH